MEQLITTGNQLLQQYQLVQELSGQNSSTRHGLLHGLVLVGLPGHTASLDSNNLGTTATLHRYVTSVAKLRHQVSCLTDQT